MLLDEGALGGALSARVGKEYFALEFELLPQRVRLLGLVFPPPVQPACD